MFLAVTVHADGGISASHRLLVADPVENETFVTLELTVINTGSTPLSEITLILTSPAPISDSAANSLTMESLGVGEEFSLLWNISVMGTEQISSMMKGDLYLDALATDQFGKTIKIQVTSKGGAE